MSVTPQNQNHTTTAPANHAAAHSNNNAEPSAAVSSYLDLAGYTHSNGNPSNAPHHDEVNRFGDGVQTQTPNFSLTPNDLSIFASTPGGSESFRTSNTANAQTPGLFFTPPNAKFANGELPEEFTAAHHHSSWPNTLQTPPTATTTHSAVQAATSNHPQNHQFPDLATPPFIDPSSALAQVSTSNNTAVHAPQLQQHQHNHITAATTYTNAAPSVGNKRKLSSGPALNHLPPAKKRKPSLLKLPQKNNVLVAKKVQQQKNTSSENTTTTTTTTTTTSIASSSNSGKQQSSNAASTTDDTVSEEVQMKRDEKDPKRQWRIISKQTPFELTVQVSSKTRCDPETIVVPREMYSSLKYQIKVSIGCSKEMKDQLPFLIARCTVVDVDDEYTEILKDGKIILDDLPQVALAQTETGYAGTLKVQFTDCSYHHDSHEFAWEIKFCDPKNLAAPLLMMRSAPYRVLARRPKSSKKKAKSTTSKKAKTKSKTKKGGKTSKKTSDKKDSSSEESQNPFAAFEAKLDELVRSTEFFKEDEKQEAMKLVSQKLLAADPTLFINKLKNEGKKQE